MQIIDTHTHLYLKEFKEDIDEVIERAINNGIEKFIFPAINSAHMKEMHKLRNKYPNSIHLMSGLHPVYVKENFKEELDLVAESLSDFNYVAVGEIGIDLYWDKSYQNQQQQAFDLQIEWAKCHDLPIVIHCRNAFNEVFEVLEDHKSDGLHGIFHCFTGTMEHAFRAIDYNLKLGIGGVITFKNGKIDKFLHEIPLHTIVLETDAPYLAPIPHRGKRNESKYLPLIRDKVAQCYKLSPEEIGAITTQNAKAVFEKNNVGSKTVSYTHLTLPTKA